MHSKVAEEFEKQGLVTRNYSGGSNAYGRIGRYESTDIYEVPFHNASVPNKQIYYKMLISESTKLPVIKEIKKENVILKELSIPVKAKLSEVAFILPDSGNSITDKDIVKGTIRITASFKSYFPSHDSIVDLEIKGAVYKVRLVKRGSRSDLLKLGKPLIQQLGVKANGRLKFTKTGLNSYIIETI